MAERRANYIAACRHVKLVEAQGLLRSSVETLRGLLGGESPAEAGGLPPFQDIDLYGGVFNEDVTWDIIMEGMHNHFDSAGGAAASAGVKIPISVALRCAM